VGGNFNMDDDALQLLLTQHPNRHKYDTPPLTAAPVCVPLTPLCLLRFVCDCSFRELYVSGVVLSAGTVALLGEACPKLRTLAIGYQDHLSEQVTQLQSTHTT
jgi:hypothetical protein